MAVYKRESIWWWVLVAAVGVGLVALAGFLIPSHAFGQDFKPDDAGAAPVAAQGPAQPETDLWWRPWVRTLLTPEVALAVLGLGTTIWKHLQAKNYKEAGEVAFKGWGALMAANNVMKRTLPPEERAKLVATLTAVNKQAGTQQLMEPMVHDMNDDSTADASEIVREHVERATRKMRKTVIETPTPTVADVSPAEGIKLPPAEAVDQLTPPPPETPKETSP